MFEKLSNLSIIRTVHNVDKTQSKEINVVIFEVLIPVTLTTQVLA